MELMDVIRSRRSIRSFKPDPVPDEIMQEILDAGRLAPSALNAQNWHFGVITDHNFIKQLVGAAGGQLWVAEAPVLIALCVRIDTDLRDKHDDDPEVRLVRTRYGGKLIDYVNEYPDRKTMNALLHSPDVLLAGQQMQLAAVNHGLSTCWVSYMDLNRVCELLELPENITCTYMMALGYGKGKPDPIERRELKDIVFHNKWGS